MKLTLVQACEYANVIDCLLARMDGGAGPSCEGTRCQEETLPRGMNST